MNRPAEAHGKYIGLHEDNIESKKPDQTLSERDQWNKEFTERQRCRAQETESWIKEFKRFHNADARKKRVQDFRVWKYLAKACPDKYRIRIAEDNAHISIKIQALKCMASDISRWTTLDESRHYSSHAFSIC